MSEIEERKAEALEGAIVDHAGGQGASRGELAVRIASELLERARAEGVSLVGGWSGPSPPPSALGIHG